MVQLNRQLIEHNEQGEMLMASKSNASLLKQELALEQGVRREAEARVVALEEQLGQV